MELELIERIADVEATGENAAVATIYRTWGSTPRSNGAKMLVLPDGRTLGTIGGGCGESAVRQVALDVISNGKSIVYRVGQQI